MSAAAEILKKFREGEISLGEAEAALQTIQAKRSPKVPMSRLKRFVKNKEWDFGGAVAAIKTIAIHLNALDLIPDFSGDKDFNEIVKDAPLQDLIACLGILKSHLPSAINTRDNGHGRLVAKLKDKDLADMTPQQKNGSIDNEKRDEEDDFFEPDPAEENPLSSTAEALTFT